METHNGQIGAHPSEPVSVGALGFEQEWLDVTQAVVLCAELGLIRTPKTVRKWAERSSGLPDGDVVARKEDTPWGYRWMIERASLVRKVEEELEFQSAHQPEPVCTSLADDPTVLNEKKPSSNDEPAANVSEPVQTRPVPIDYDDQPNDQQTQPEPGAHFREPVQTGSETELVMRDVRERMSDKDKEIKFLRTQLAEAQIEIGRRAASTDEALKTIDRVVRSFELQAEANRALALGAGQPEPEYQEQTTPIRFTPRAVENPSGHQDIRRV